METEREELIKARAHRIWEDAGRPEGHEQAHWQQAEAELASEEGGVTRPGTGSETPTAQPMSDVNDTPGTESGAPKKPGK
ncbi:DUF2934 domain-containing protein [Paracoccus sp. 1_MG-2023]|uniref:DUF2934 domain-containing protein n=1 Tax=unclassified Paracoccus (in: a-proteobacteria) TaxID=2688777 RepID=UPI001C094BD0|nr:MULTISPECIES: DUF2934 domain-containing protein [unclassified Paracoccus (in: a-proteobacteria)]MBU2956086.1 DUF2934 domain-containing protein [Paracoccus sp. C2R09]MDO6669492.1 DUF2934 domain-containing protein [Paracoccus sp. 1_MG-2023]